MKHAFALGLLAAAAALPVHAGTIYVPYATDEVVGSARYRTEIAVTNPGDAPARVQMLFVSADGVRLPGRTETVAAHGTSVVAGLAPAGAQGRVEVTGPAALVVSARLNAYDREGGLLSSAAEPVVSADNLIPAGQTIHLQGLANTADAATRLGIVTAGDLGSCSFAAYSADGAELGATSATGAAALARDFAEPLQALRAGSIAEARLEVTCDAPAFAYAAVLATDGSRTAFVAPSTSLRADLTNVVDAVRAGGLGNGEPLVGNPGGNRGGNGDPSSPSTPSTPSTPNGTPAGAPVALDKNGSFQVDGMFLDAKAGASFQSYNLDLKQGVKYHKVTVDYDLYVNRYQTPLFHGISSLRRTGKTLFMGLLMRADKSKTLVDLGHDRLLKDAGPWHEHTQYHITMICDAAAKKATVQIFQDGRLVESVSGKLTSTDLRLNTPAKPVHIDFGGTKVADGAYFPPVGWQFSNLKVVAIP
jgi:hypothetical protein